jgi:hypothetical protein
MWMWANRRLLRTGNNYGLLRPDDGVLRNAGYHLLRSDDDVLSCSSHSVPDAGHDLLFSLHLGVPARILWSPDCSPCLLDVVDGHRD